MANKKTDQRELVGFWIEVSSEKLCLGAEHIESFGSAVGVTPFVVIPSTNFDHVSSNHEGEFGIVDGAVGIGNDVLQDDGLVAIGENTFHRAFRSGFERGVDFSNSHADTGFEFHDEVGERTRWRWHAESTTVEFAFHRWNHFADGAGSTGGGRHDVYGSRTTATQVLVRKVENVLVVGVGVNRGHETALNAPGVVEHFDQRRKAVGGAGSIRYDVMFRGVVEIVVDADADRNVRVGSGCGDEHFFCTSGKVSGGFVAVGEETSRFEDNVHAEFGPWQFRGIAFGEGVDFVTAHDDEFFVVSNFTLELALGGVVLEQMGECVVVGKVVDGNDVAKFFVAHGAQNVASDASESVDGVFRHNVVT